MVMDDHISFQQSILSATCLPTAPMTPPPGWALLPQIQIPPILPLVLFVNRFSMPMLPWKMLPSVSEIRFSRSWGVRMSMKCTSRGSSRYWLISLRKMSRIWECGMGPSLAMALGMFGWQGVYCRKQFMMQYPSGHIVLSKMLGIVMSMKGFRLILSVLVCSKATFSCSIVSQFMWMVPCSNFYAGRGWLRKALNFGSFFNAMLSFVAAPLYSMFLNLLYTALGSIFYGSFTRLKKVTLLVQLLRITFDSMISPLASLTPVGLSPSQRIQSTLLLTWMVAPLSRADWSRIQESRPLPPSTQPHWPCLPSSNSPMTWCRRTQAVEWSLTERFSPMMPSVASDALRMSDSNQLSSISSTEQVRKRPKSKQSMPVWQELFRKFSLSARLGDFRELQGILSTFLSQKEQNCDRYCSYFGYTSASFLLNFAISSMVLCWSLYMIRYLSTVLVGVREGMSRQWIFSPFSNSPSSLMMFLRNRDSTQEQRENLNPGMSSSVSAAPPTRCLCSRTRMSFLAAARQLAATSPLCPAPIIMASYLFFSILRIP